MQRSIIIIIVFLLLNNLIAQDFSAVESTFKDIVYLFDNNPKTFAVSGDLKFSEQQIVINLKERKYIKEMNVMWSKEAYPAAYQILGSIDYINWFVIRDNIQTKKGLQQDVIKNNISMDNKVAHFIKIIIPQETNLKQGTEKIVKIAGINISFSVNLTPKVLNYQLKNIHKHTIQIVWNTDYESLGQIRYGLSIDTMNKVHTGYIYTKEHTLSIKDLLEGKQYYFQIINQTPDNRYTTSRVLTFKTTGLPLPEIEEIEIVKKTHNFIELLIKANIDTRLDFNFGKQNNQLDKNIKSTAYKKKHRIKIKDLRPLSKYYTRIILQDKRANKFDQLYEFETGEFNIALNKKVEGTFQNRFIADVFQLTGDVLKRVNDGSFNYKTGMAVSYDPLKDQQFVTIDLGKKEEIEKIITYWRALAYPYLYFIYFSDDNKKWQKYDKSIILQNKSIAYLEGIGMPLVIGEADIKGIQTRYVKIMVPKGTPYFKKYQLYNFLQLVECKIYGTYNSGY